MSHIINVLQKLNKSTKAEVYYVGGFVRDLIRRKDPNNIDIIIRNYPLLDIIKYLKDYGEIKRTKSIYQKIIFKCKGEEVRISLPQKGKKSDPFGSLEDDAILRDFTINAMYLPIDRRYKKYIIDFHNGLKDIKFRKLKTVGNINSTIQISPIRSLRAVSFASCLNYKIDSNLFYGIRTTAKLIEKSTINERRDELIKILLSKKPSKYIKMLYKVGLLYFLIPELYMCYGMEQNKKYHKHDVFTHCILACDNVEADLILRLSALFHDIGKLQTRKEHPITGHVTFYRHEAASSRLSKRILKRLNFDNDIITKVVELTYLHMYNYEPDKWTDAAVKRFIKNANITEEDLDKLDTFPLFLVRRADRLANGNPYKEISYRQELFKKRICDTFKQTHELTINDLAVNGKVLMEEFNLKEGPTVGHIINYLFTKVSKNYKLNNREILIEEASKYLSEVLK